MKRNNVLPIHLTFYFSKTIELSLGFSCKNSKYFIFVKPDTLLSLNSAVWRRKWQLSPAFLPGEFHGQRRLAGDSLCHLKEIGHNWTTFHFTSYETMRSQVAQAHFPERWRKASSMLTVTGLEGSSLSILSKTSL